MFDINAFDNVTSGSSLGPRIWSYGSSTDTLATIAASGYFNDVRFRIEDKDLVYVSGTDGAQFIKLSSAGGDEPVTTTVWIPSSGGGGGGSVVLPTVAGAIAGFTDTSGTISSGPQDLTTDGSIAVTANVTVDGSVTAGAIITAQGMIRSGSPDGGFQGSFNAYPTSVSSGYFSMYALDASNGNYSSTLYNNPSISASKTYLLPNPITNNEVYIAAYDGAAPPTTGHVAVFGANLGLLTDGGPPSVGTVNSGTANQLGYYSANGTAVSGLALTAQSVLTTDLSGQHAYLPMGNGFLVIGNGGGNPTASTLTAGTGISITNGAGSITIAASGAGFAWNNVSGTTQSAAVANGYIIGNASQTTVSLPATAPIGSTIAVQGKGAGGWILVANVGQTIQLGQSATSSAGSITSAANFDSIEVVCITANTTWSVTRVFSSGVTTA